MKSEDKFWVSFWAMVFSFIIILIVTIVFYNLKREEQMVKAGLQQYTQQTPNGNYTIWQKEHK